ncbi:MAG: alpha-2-macroglobulin family protein [Janthinobacterium lividum]
MRYLLLLGCLLLTTLLADSAAPGPNPPYAPQWRKIDALLAKDQTATAAPLLEKLYQQAQREDNGPAHVRALLYKIRLLESKENDADEKAIALLEGDVQTATFPARPILHSLLASLYASYFNQHRYQLYQRTPGAAPTADPATPGAADGGTDLATWDARRLGAAIAHHYRASVEDEPPRQLQTTLAALGDLATGGDAEGRARRPTLYDLLAQRAIAGLQNQELTLAEPEQPFALADYPTAALFGPAAEFAALELRTPADDSLGHELLTLRLLQQLTAQRLQQPGNQAALADVDLQRLNYLRGLAQGTDQAAAYEPALGRLAAAYQALPIGTEFVARQAEARREAGDNVAAVRLARQAEARFPASGGAARARQLREQLEQPELSFSAASLVVPGQPWRLDLTTRNVHEVRAWAYRVSLREWQAAQQYQTRNQLAAERYAAALRRGPAAQWVIPMPTQPLDYQAQKLATAGPALPLGYYLVVASSGPTPALSPTADVATSYALLGASELSVTHRREPSTGAPQLLVLQRQSGQPLAGVSAQATYQRYDPASRQPVARRSEVQPTSQAGLVELPAPALAPTPNPSRQQPEQVAEVRVWRGRDTLVVEHLGYYNQRSPNDKPETTCFLFTDRAIYRPGQTVYFKGILVQKQGGQGQLQTQAAQAVELVDANGDTAQKLSFTTNDFGSFNGSFVLPAGQLNGEWKLSADDGELAFSVEDYKRPTFYVQLDSVPGRPALGQPVAVPGRALAYAGPPTDGARVSYRVVRRELWPLDYGFRGGRLGFAGQRGLTEIAHGTATTDAEGGFRIGFTPPLGPAPPQKGRWQPGYVFEVTADVTSAAGETRSASRGVVLGRNPLSLRLTGPDVANKRHLPTFSLLAASATGELRAATGTLRLLARRFRPNPTSVPGPAPTAEADELPGEVVKAQPFDTRQGPRLAVAALLAGVPTGRYRLEALAAGPDSTRAQLDFTLYDSEAATVPFATPDWFVALSDSVRPGQPAGILLGSSEADTHILLEVERGGQLLRQEWLTLQAGEQRRVAVASGPATALGPLYVHTTQVRANYLYQHTATVQVAEPPQPLQLSIATFRDRLQPGQRETWRVSIRQADGKPADAELLATLYDQSLDVFRQHRWQGLNFGGSYFPARFEWEGEFGEFNSESYAITDDGSGLNDIDYPEINDWQRHLFEVPDQDELKDEDKIVPTVTVKDNTDALDADGAPGAGPSLRARAAAPMMALQGKVAGVAISGSGYIHTDGSNTQPKPAAPDLTAVPTRADFRETALWSPALRTDKNGEVVLEFQLPEAVTRWQLLALAHDRQLHTGQLARQLVTQKQIQLTPNAPRFLRPGDSFTFPATFANLTDAPVQGTAQLVLLDAATGQDVTAQLLPGAAQRPVRAAAHQSQAVGWPLVVPAEFTPVAVTYRVVAQTAVPRGQRRAKGAATFSDGEENTLPVLPNRVLVTESLPLPVVGPGTRTFELPKLTSTSSATRRNQSLTLELTANPAWYAVQSLPYLMEYPYECAEQVFSRLYANLLAAQILRANPRLRPILAEWQRIAQSGPAAPRNALASKLTQNQDFKNVLLQETPWVRDAQGETERLARLSTLLDTVRLRTETATTLAKLRALQLPDGSFPWFAQLPADRYITQLIVAGFGKLKTLGAFDASQDAAARPLLQAALGYLDQQLTRDYAALRQEKNGQLAADHLGDLQVQALYARSYWPPPAAASAAQVALGYYQGQGARYWPGRPRYLQAQLALALHRAGAAQPAATILRALVENALHSPELGMYWADVQPGYYWREAPTETQATLIEAFAEIADDQKAVDEQKLWLLRQKQTQHWPSTRATADACYALLLRGTDWLAPTPPLQVTVGGEPLATPAAQAGTGYVARTWPAADIKPTQGRVVVTKPSAGVAWGALYWQYFEDIDQVTPATAALSLERQLYRETRTATGPRLEQLAPATSLRVGDVLVVRLVLRTDRALEYVHLKDQRAAGLELINQLSGYQYQAGLGYYESPRDAATHFFFGAVPRGTHVLEYRLRASQAGNFSGGLSEVQCLYAPEFRATSAGQRLTIGQP